MKNVAIVGGGATGVIAAIHLLAEFGARAQITIFEPGPQLGAGVAFGTNESSHLLNVPAPQMSLFENAPGDFVAWLGRLKEEVGIPARLGATGVTAAHIPALVDVAVRDTCHQTNPRPCTAEDFRRIFAEAI